ncbi:hypothetical protein G6F68_018774 [Rhizopus microsporus]|nr:hypothetical protein G6F68_018774 [Rhizopus microsporus]
MRLIASTYEEPEQVIEMYRNDPQLMSGLQNRVMEEQVIDWIAARAPPTEEKLSFQDAIRHPEPGSDGGRADQPRRACLRHLFAPAEGADHLPGRPGRGLHGQPGGCPVAVPGG